MSVYKNLRRVLGQRDNILQDPVRYIGAIEKRTESSYVFENDELVYREVTYVPGLCKIFDDILLIVAGYSNSSSCFKVNIDVKESLIMVLAEGYGDVDLIRSIQTEVYTIIFSSMFEMEISDGEKKFKQVFMSNAKNVSRLKITNCYPREKFTEFTFKPDLARFNMNHLEDDVVGLMEKRVLDLAGCLGRIIVLNNRCLPVRSFVDYVDLCIKSKSGSGSPPRFTEKFNNKWEICVSISQGKFQQVSFVNSINTIKGGTHVDYVTNQITKHVTTVVNKKNKQANVKAEDVKRHLWVFVNAIIDNPTFDSQTKETLTTRQSTFRSKCKLSHEFLERVANSEIVERLDSCAEVKLSKECITELGEVEVAKEAGGNNAEKCTLILTNSRKNLAMIGPMDLNYYGVFLLSDELLNAREASHKQILENDEIQHLKKTLGLQKHWNGSVKSLRYGHLMIMTDQVHDGSHIKGLLMNFIHSFCPSMFDIPSFLVEIIIPILKATHNNGNILFFYTMSEYYSWYRTVGDNRNDWLFDWFPDYVEMEETGLSSISKEAKMYYEILKIHKEDFTCVNLNVDVIDVEFGKKTIEKKSWVRDLESWDYLNLENQRIELDMFVNKFNKKHLILFPLADLQRFVPSMVDGLNHVQRKILFCAFECDLVDPEYVDQFSCFVLVNSTHQHGVEVLSSTIIGMAQDFVGSNNINLFNPQGSFGTREMGGKDPGSAWHLRTNLTPIARFLFPKEDDILLHNKNGIKRMEPTWYAPIIPFVLVNGSERIGTGWSTFVPNYNPSELCANIRCLLEGNEVVDMDPWYKGFDGTIEKTIKENGESYTISGKIKSNDTTLWIQELPVCKWTHADYEKFLDTAMSGTGKLKEPFIQKYSWTHNDDATTTGFEIIMSKENLRMTTEELLKKFELTTTISTSNMLMFDQYGVINKYDNPKEILKDFYKFRLSLYKDRKEMLLESHRLKVLELENQIRYIRGVIDGTIKIFVETTSDITHQLEEQGFDKIRESYDYLLSMHSNCFSKSNIRKLHLEHENFTNKINDLKITTPENLWLDDLKALELELDKLKIKESEAVEPPPASKEAGKVASRKTALGKRKNKLGKDDKRNKKLRKED